MYGGSADRAEREQTWRGQFPRERSQRRGLKYGQPSGLCGKRPDLGADAMDAAALLGDLDRRRVEVEMKREEKNRYEEQSAYGPRGAMLGLYEMRGRHARLLRDVPGVVKKQRNATSVVALR